MGHSVTRYVRSLEPLTPLTRSAALYFATLALLARFACSLRLLTSLACSIHRLTHLLRSLPRGTVEILAVNAFHRNKRVFDLH